MAIRGRKKKYNPKTFPELAEQYAADGLIDAEIAQKLGISRDTFYQYKKDYPDFSDSIDKGKQVTNQKVEKALLSRCLGIEYEEVTTEIVKDADGKPQVKSQKKIKKRIAPDVKAIELWLSNRDSENWKRGSNVDITTKGDKLNTEPPKIIMFDGESDDYDE